MCKEAKILLGVSTIFTLGMGLSGIFANIFFWRETGDFTIIAIYNLMHYIFTPISFIIAGFIAKKKNGIWALRIGLLLYSIFYVLILLIGKSGVWAIYFLGVVYGIACGFYWLAFNTLSFDFTSPTNRDTFNGFNGSCSGLASIVAPFTSAYIITRFEGIKGYSIVFSITLALFVVLMLISLTLRCKNCGNKLNLKVAFSKNNEDWSKIRKATMCWGFRDVIIVFIVNLLIFQSTGSELSLGKLSLIGAFISSLAYILVQKIIKPKRRRLAIFIGASSALVGAVMLSLRISYTILLIYTIIDSFFIPFFMIQLSSTTFNVIDKSHEGDLRVEYMINKDIVLNLGRIISTVVLVFLLSTFKTYNILNIYIIIIGVTPLISGYFLSKLKSILDGKVE
ncbi:MFS transporter [Clostridium sp. C8-1-8]|uniref:MFS transporter n=1 Tax=Clostridium sp. C8-1-8 TaxID=2698831 RepID=UPI001370A595|nr:MFS transporter [Clostridium sp. C8-1-8]